MNEMTQTDLTKKLMGMKLYEDLEAGNYVMKVDRAEAKTYESAKVIPGTETKLGTFSKIVFTTSVVQGKGKGKTVRAEFVVDFTPAAGAEAHKDSEDYKKALQTVEIGTRKLLQFAAACGWYPANSGAKIAARVNDGTAKYIDETFSSMTSLDGSQFFGKVGKTSDGRYVELQGFKDLSAANIGEAGVEGTPPF